MNDQIGILAATAATIGVVHTITGPDHYLPFIVMSRARRWSLTRTLTVTGMCGIGHVLGSVILGVAGIALGLAVGRIEAIEGVRGDIAAWLLISFGLVYMVWGLRRAHRSRLHEHAHLHEDGTLHTHEHGHAHDHAHVHARDGASLTPWALFVIFVLGPCEPLIPILMYPAARADTGGLVLVTTIFCVATIGTMLAMVLAAERGLRLLPTRGLERHVHSLAGLTILCSGLAIVFLGL